MIARPPLRIDAIGKQGIPLLPGERRHDCLCGRDGVAVSATLAQSLEHCHRVGVEIVTMQGEVWLPGDEGRYGGAYLLRGLMSAHPCPVAHCDHMQVDVACSYHLRKSVDKGI